MIAAKKFFIGLLAAIILNVAAAHAEEVDPYFAWEIKNPDAYRQHDSLFKAMEYDDGIFRMRNQIYRSVNVGDYSSAATWCEVTEAVQKNAFGTDYFDAGLTELNAKLYLQADELDAAKRKINFLLENAADNPTKIRALILKADLLNRREKFAEALQAAQEADELLKTTPDEKLSLMNRSRMARAYCGVGETPKSLELAEKIFPQMQKIFGESAVDTLEMMSTVAAIYFRVQNFDACAKIMKDKARIVSEHFDKKNSTIPAKTFLECAMLNFALGDRKTAEELFDSVLKMAQNHFERGHFRISFQLYKQTNDLTKKILPAENPVQLESEFGLVFTNYLIGNIAQSIEIYHANAALFKKVFGEKDMRTLYAAKILSDDYLALGKYDDAKKIAAQNFAFCEKNFGYADDRTVEFANNLANIHYHMGKYNSADKLLDDVDSNARKILDDNPSCQSSFWIAKIAGTRMKGAYDEYSALVNNVVTKEKILSSIDPYAFMLEMMITNLKFSHDFTTNANIFTMIINGERIRSSGHSPKLLEAMNKLAETYVTAGELTNAEKFAARVFKLSVKYFGENNFYEWMSLGTLAKIRRAEGKFNDALDLDKQALQIAETVCGKKSLERMQTLDAIASDLAGDENFAEAIKIRERTLVEYKKILEDTDAATVQMMTNLAENYVAVGRYGDAVNLCDKAFELQKVPWHYGNQVSFYTCVTDLLRIKAQARKLSGDYKKSDVNYQNLISAYEYKRMSINSSDEFDEESKSKWFAEIIPDYKDAATVAVLTGNKNFACYCLEFCKGRNLIDRFDDVLVAKNYLLTADEKNILAENKKIMENCRAVTEYAEAVNDDELFLNNEYFRMYLFINTRQFSRKLREKYSTNMIPKMSSERTDILKNFDVQKNRQAIPNGACLIEFLKASDNSLVVTFLSNDGEVQAANISVDEKFFDDCKLYHDLISYPDINSMSEFGKKYLWQIGDEYKITDIREKTVADENSVKDDSKFIGLRQKLCAELSEKLLPTLERFAGKFSYWIISPDAELNLVPFETLTYRGKFLVDEKNVSYVPSLAVMNLMRNRERKNSYLGRNKELFAMGDAIYGDNDETATRGSFDENFNLAGLKWSNLPGAARELDKISALFESKNIFRREQASEKNLRQLNSSGELSQYKYLLFSAHGIFVPQRPELSSIVLSQNFDAEFDGYVTVGEWMSYDLRSDLIYLSACESGRGSYQAGEGIVGIPYALTVAGNKDTVMSLWKVNDAATAEFTSAVFEKLSRGKSEVDAINETKREFLSNPIYRDPSIWAAFVLYGI